MISDGEALEVYIEQQLVPSIGEIAFRSIGSAEKNPDRCKNIDLLWVKLKNQREES